MFATNFWHQRVCTTSSGQDRHLYNWWYWPKGRWGLQSEQVEDWAYQQTLQSRNEKQKKWWWEHWSRTRVWKSHDAVNQKSLLSRQVYHQICLNCFGKQRNIYSSTVSLIHSWTHVCCGTHIHVMVPSVSIFSPTSSSLVGMKYQRNHFAYVVKI